MKFKKNICILLVLLQSLFSLPATPQRKDNLLSPEALPKLRAPKELVQLEIPAVSQYPGSDIALMVQKSQQTRIPVSLAKRLFSETLHAVTASISPEHALRLRLHVTLCLGQKRDYLYVHQPQGMVISMKDWNEVVFARLVARAVPSSILSENDADQAAVQALKRVHATTSIEELKKGE